MATRTSSRPARSHTAPLPKGARVPQPALLLWLARALVIGALALFFASPTLLAWAEEHRPEPAAAGAERGGLLFGALLNERHDASPRAEADTPIEGLLASATFALLSPRVVAGLGAAGVLGVTLMLAEACLATAGMAAQRRRATDTPSTYLLVRASLPVANLASGRTAATPSGDAFFRAIHQAIPPASGAARLWGTAPWIGLTLTGLPDRPIELGVVVADRDPQRRADTVTAIRSVIQGQLPGAQVDQVSDPLANALRSGVTAAWREYGLRLPTHYPLRAADDVAGSDLLGPLLASLTPRGVLLSEAQIIMRPAARGLLSRGWRGRATALLLGLQAKADYALADDTRRIEAKLAAAPFEASVRVVALAEGPDAQGRLEAALSTVGEVLGQYHQRTSHHLQSLVQIGAGQARVSEKSALLARAPRFVGPPELLLPLRPWRAPDILTSIELAGLWHPPTPALGTLVRSLPCRILPAPPHAYIAPGRADRVMLGLARHADGTIGPVGPTLRDLRPPLHITAGMGAGKSRALANIAQQCVPHGFALLDGKGDDQGGSLAATVRQLIPLQDEHRLILFDILDTEWPIGLNPLAGIDLASPGARDQALGQIMAIFARLDPATWGKAPAMKEFVQMATLLVLEGERYPTLAHVKQCLLDESYRATLLPHCTNVDVTTFWTVTFPTQGEQQRSSLHALLRRFSQLLTTETTRYLVSQPASRLNLLEVIEGRQILLAPLPHVTLGDLASAVGMLLLQQFVRAAFTRPGTDQTRHSYPLIIDELQVFIGKDGDSTDLQNAITQLRGLGIAGIYAHQTLDQLGTLKSEMLNNTGSRLILRTQEPDASTYAKLYAASGVTATDIAAQDASEHQYATLQCDDVRTGLFSMIVLPWPRPLDLPVLSDAGPDWQTRIPSGSPDPAADAELLGLVYGTHARVANVVQVLVECDEADWEALLARWEALRAFHRQYILDHPGCIALDRSISDPDPVRQAELRAQQQRLDRQRWLSRLLVATPHVLAAAEYARIRRQIEPADGQALPAGRSGRTRGWRGDASLPRQVPGGLVVVEPSLTPTPELVVPIGFVSGATPSGRVALPVPLIADTRTTAEVMKQRGARRARADISAGFDDLLALDETEATP